jgi:hypothetical protein
MNLIYLLLFKYLQLLFCTVIITQMVRIFPSFYGNRIFSTVFTEAYHWTLSCAS